MYGRVSRGSQSLEESPERINYDITRPAAAREIGRRDNACFLSPKIRGEAVFATAMPEIIADEK